MKGSMAALADPKHDAADPVFLRKGEHNVTAKDDLMEQLRLRREMLEEMGRMAELLLA